MLINNALFKWHTICLFYCKKNKMNLKLLCMTGCLLTGSLWGWTQEDTIQPDKVMTLTLRQTVQMARNGSPAAVAARHTFRSAWWNYRSFRANYLPAVVLSSGPELTRTINKVMLPDGTEKYVSQNMFTVDGTLAIRQNVPFTGGSFFVESTIQRMKFYDTKSVAFRTSPVVVGYSQELFGYNSLKWDKRIEPVRYREAQKIYVETLELVSADAARKFFALAGAQRDYEMACFNYANADTLYQFAGGRYNIGTITENELLQLEVNRLTESTNRMDAVIEVDNSRQALRSLLGLDREVILQVRIDQDIPNFRVDPGRVFDLFSRNSPDIEAMQRKLLESRSSVAQARSNAGLKADLYLQCGLSQTGETMSEAYRDPLDQQQVSVGISLPLLDWGRGRGKVKVAKSRQDLVEIQVEQEKNDLEMNVRKLVMQFNLQYERVEIAQKTELTASRRYEVARKLYLLGRSSILDLNAAITEKDRASRSFLFALSNYWNLYYVLRSMTLFDFENDREIERVKSEE